MSMELSELKGVGPAREKTLRAMGINSLRDLLFMLPVRYEDYTTVAPCSTRETGMVLVSGTVEREPKLSVFHGLKKVTTSVSDASGHMPLCWYNQPWMKENIHAGDEVRLYGRLTVRNNLRVLQNAKIIPEGLMISPVYRTMNGIPAGSLQKLIRSALAQMDDCCPETLPASFRMRYRLCTLDFALRQVHCPEDREMLDIALRRLNFERILCYLLFISGAGAHRQAARPFLLAPDAADRFWEQMPFPPTGAQRRVLAEIADDLRRETAMCRLVQGDVGCGKTAVAFGAIRLAREAGYQSCMMAPTEILAAQHYRNAVSLLEPMGVRCRLLTGSTKTAERRRILADLLSGECDAVFGTHALISKGVEYRNLGLAITDEQHRFGVRQRSELQKKGAGEQTAPHVLVMSATPIPRTLALILYGDLDLSVIDELPSGRKPVRTRLVPEYKREDMYGFLRREAEKGRQAYIVCPLVEESEESDSLHSVKSHFEQLKNHELKALRLALTWGAQKPEEKERTLRDFSEGKYDVLVSTTVIEVGVNNPNATIMIVEDAERYGLSQLHQLRGRVGRGSEESWCFLLSDASEKLKILCASNDGFVISQKDLELRGPGDLIGTRQSGEPGNFLLSADLRLLDEVTRCVRELHRDPARAAELRELEALSETYFSSRGISVALN